MSFFKLRWFIPINIVLGILTLIGSFMVRAEDKLFLFVVILGAPNIIFLVITLTKLQLIKLPFPNYIDKRNKKLVKTLKQNKDDNIENVYITGRKELLGYEGHILMNDKYFILTKKKGIIFVNKDLVSKKSMFDEMGILLMIQGDSVYVHSTGVNPVLYAGISSEDFNEGDNIKAVEILEDFKSQVINKTKGVITETMESNVFGLVEELKNKKKPK